MATCILYAVNCSSFCILHFLYVFLSFVFISPGNSTPVQLQLGALNSHIYIYRLPWTVSLAIPLPYCGESSLDTPSSLRFNTHAATSRLVNGSTCPRVIVHYEGSSLTWRACSAYIHMCSLSSDSLTSSITVHQLLNGPDLIHPETSRCMRTVNWTDMLYQYFMHKNTFTTTAKENICLQLFYSLSNQLAALIDAVILNRHFLEKKHFFFHCY